MLGFVKGNADIMRMIENYDMMKAGGIYLGQKVALAKGSCEGKVMDGYVEKGGGGSFAAGTKGAWELGVGRGGVNCDGDDRPMMAVAQPGKEPMKVKDERTR